MNTHVVGFHYIFQRAVNFLRYFLGEPKQIAKSLLTKPYSSQVRDLAACVALAKADPGYQTIDQEWGVERISALCQFDISDHGLHCGYYALYFAKIMNQFGDSRRLQTLLQNRRYFNKYLRKWEQHILQLRRNTYGLKLDKEKLLEPYSSPVNFIYGHEIKEIIPINWIKKCIYVAEYIQEGESFTWKFSDNNKVQKQITRLRRECVGSISFVVCRSKNHWFALKFYYQTNKPMVSYVDSGNQGGPFPKAINELAGIIFYGKERTVESLPRRV